MKARASMREDGKQPSPPDIVFICEDCGFSNSIKGSFRPKIFRLRLYWAVCASCGHERNPSDIGPGYFRCQGECGIVYRQRKHWNPVKGMCMSCYMREWRLKNKNEDDISRKGSVPMP